MKVRIRSVADAGDIRKERLVLEVVVSTEIGNYLVLCAGYAGDSVTTDVHKAFWFPYKKLSAGDLVVVYTKSGRDTEKALRKERVAHFFYWGLERSIWERRDRAAVLLYAPRWESKGPDEL